MLETIIDYKYQQNDGVLNSVAPMTIIAVTCRPNGNLSVYVCALVKHHRLVTAMKTDLVVQGYN